MTDRFSWLVWLARARLILRDGNAIAVLLTIVEHAQPDGRSWPSQETMAKETGFGITKVKDMVKLLRDSGVFTVHRVRGHNVYQLQRSFIDSEPESPPAAEGGEPECGPCVDDDELDRQPHSDPPRPLSGPGEPHSDPPQPLSGPEPSVTPSVTPSSRTPKEVPSLRSGTSVVSASPTTDGDSEDEAIDDAPDDPADTTESDLEVVEAPKPTQAALPGLEDAQPPPKQAPRKLVMAFYAELRARGHTPPNTPSPKHLALAKREIDGSEARFDRLMFLIPEWLALPPGHHDTKRPRDFAMFVTKALECEALAFVRPPATELEGQAMAALEKDVPPRICEFVGGDPQHLRGSPRQWACAVMKCAGDLADAWGLYQQIQVVKGALLRAVRIDEVTRRALTPRYLVERYDMISRIGAPEVHRQVGNHDR